MGNLASESYRHLHLVTLCCSRERMPVPHHRVKEEPGAADGFPMGCEGKSLLK